jgi:hypothetical protein
MHADKYDEYQRSSAFVRVHPCSHPKGHAVTESIGTLNEKPLHAALKAWYARPGDQFEVHVDGFVVDIVRGDLLIEIQTRHFAAIRRKLAALAEHHPVRVVYPIAQEKWIVRQAADGQPLSRRKSPRRGTLEHVFHELTHVPHLLSHANFSIDVLFIQEEEIRRHGPARAWRRRGWVTHERRLLQVVGQHLLATPADLSALLPATLPDPFTTADLAAALAQPRALAQKMVYCLREMGTITPVGKRGNTILYTVEKG